MAEINTHNTKEHLYKCKYCEEVVQSSVSLDAHTTEYHTYDCEVCDFSGVDEETLVYHILLTHTKPNANGFFVCEDCEYQTNTKENYGNHYKNYHNRCEKIELSSVNDDELKEIKINYERLEKLYHSVLENADKTKAEHELKILQMNDDHARILKQNEVLQERIEIVYKLGKSYLERSCNLCNNTDRCREEGSNVNEAHKKAEQIEVETTNKGWKSNTLRGFKREKIGS